jgi:hypothetical protein
MNPQNKYLKYKYKYLNLKNLYGGMIDNDGTNVEILVKNVITGQIIDRFNAPQNQDHTFNSTIIQDIFRDKNYGYDYVIMIENRRIYSNLYRLELEEFINIPLNTLSIVRIIFTDTGDNNILFDINENLYDSNDIERYQLLENEDFLLFLKHRKYYDHRPFYIRTAEDEVMVQSALKNKPEWQNNKIVASNVVKLYPKLFKHISADLKADYEFIISIFVSCDDCGIIFDLVSENIKHQLGADKNIMSIILKSNGSALEFASDEIKNDKQLILIAFRQNYSNLRFALPNIKKNKEFIIQLINQNWKAFKFSNLQDDIDVITAAMNISVYAFEFISSRLRSDKSFVLGLMNKYKIQLASRLYTSVYHYMVPILRIFNFLSPALKSDKDIILQIVPMTINVMSYINPILENDPDVKKLVEIAMKNRGDDISNTDADLSDVKLYRTEVPNRELTEFREI